MSNQLLMKQVMLQQTPFLKIDEYHFKVLEKRYNVSLDWSVEQIDAWYHEALNHLFEEMVSLGLPESLIEPLFIKHFKMHQATSLDETVDQHILETFQGPYEHAALEVYSKMVLDFYRLNKFLRFNQIDEVVAEGYLAIDDFKHYQDVDRLVLNSLYYKSLENLTVDNFEGKTTLALHSGLRDFIWGLKVKESLFALVYFKIVELKNVRAFLKATRYGFNPKEFIYV